MSPFFILESFHSFFPFLFVLTLEVDSFYSPFLLQSFTTLPAAQCLITFSLQFLQNTAFGRLATHSGHCIYLLHSHSSTTFPAMLFVPSNCVSDGGMVNMQVGSSLTFLCRFKCQQALRLPRLFTECSFLDCDVLS